MDNVDINTLYKYIDIDDDGNIKPHLLESPSYINYKCSCCGKIISIKAISECFLSEMLKNIKITMPVAVESEDKKHNCPNIDNEKEHPFLIPYSVSDMQLPDSEVLREESLEVDWDQKLFEEYKSEFRLLKRITPEGKNPFESFGGLFE